MIVLDTHILLWYLLDAPELAPHIQALLEQVDEEVCISAISVWEIMMLHEKGRIQMDTPAPGQAIRQAIAALRLQELPLTAEIAILSRTLEFQHSDPADRYIAATALANNARLATADERLRRLSWIHLAF